MCWGVIDILFLIIVVRQRYAHGGRGPIRVDVGVDGLRFHWAKGPSRLEPWQGVRFPIMVKDFSTAGYQAQMRISRFSWIALSGEAAVAIASEAHRQGLHVTTQQITGPTGSQGSRRRSRASGKSTFPSWRGFALSLAR